jgi:hypothetical protein
LANSWIEVLSFSPHRPAASREPLPDRRRTLVQVHRAPQELRALALRMRSSKTQ